MKRTSLNNNSSVRCKDKKTKTMSEKIKIKNVDVFSVITIYFTL